MRLLLDTHVAIWAIASPERIPARITSTLLDDRNEVWVSSISLAEIAIKHMLARRGSGMMPLNARSALERFRAAGFRFLPLKSKHAIELETLAPHHGDPFDRLLIAQAFHEPMNLVTHDQKVGAYSNDFICFS